MAVAGSTGFERGLLGAGPWTMVGARAALGGETNQKSKLGTREPDIAVAVKNPKARRRLPSTGNDQRHVPSLMKNTGQRCPQPRHSLLVV